MTMEHSWKILFGLAVILLSLAPCLTQADLSYTNSTDSTESYLSDGNDMTCTSDPSAQSATITLTGQFPFTWFRIRVNEPGDLQQAFTLQFKNMSTTDSADCGNMKTVLVNDITMDIFCDVPVTADQVILTGDVVKSLCSLYISAGRNLALGQKTWQASYYVIIRDPSLAVDGNTAGNENNCTHTRINGLQQDARWGVTLLQPAKVNKYVLYNRQDRIHKQTPYCCRERLEGFILRSFDQSGDEAFSYQENDTVPRNVYTVTSPSSSLPVSQVNITASYVDGDYGIILSLCEVEIYGDSVCPSGKYGRECEATCNCAGDTECLVTGGCPDSCAAGYQGEACNEPCPESRHGVNCKETCSISCVDQKCNSVSGDCSECPAGRKGKQCDEVCNPKTWGAKCVQHCSTNCLNQLCNSTTGICLKCSPGKLGSRCDEDCPAHTYGDNCTLSCSNVCLNQECDGTTGFCTSCPAGKTGKECKEDCPFLTFGDGCKQTCSKHCGEDGSCHPVSGECSHECMSGYTGVMCQNICEGGKYGNNCGKECSLNCNINGTEPEQSPCDHVSGACKSGCQNGYQDPLCVNLPEKENSPEDQSGLVTGLGVGIAILAVILVVVAAVYCYRRRSRAAGGSEQRGRPDYDNVDMTRQEDRIYRNMSKAEDGNDPPKNVTKEEEEVTDNQDHRPRSSVSYVNADVGHYEFPTEDDPNDDMIYEQIVQKGPAIPKEGTVNSGYVNI